MNGKASLTGRNRVTETLRGDLSEQQADTRRLRKRIQELEEPFTIAATATSEKSHLEKQLRRGYDRTRSVTPMRRRQGRAQDLRSRAFVCGVQLGLGVEEREIRNSLIVLIVFFKFLGISLMVASMTALR